jgi:hypothetical protein
VFFDKYDHYHFFINFFIQDISEILIADVRIDDLTISKIIIDAKTRMLNQSWLADFDTQNMIRVTRMSLSIATKIFVNVEEMNALRQKIFVDEEEWYYLWWRRIHLLCDMKRLNEKMYKIRSSHETFATNDLIWLKKYRAILQTAPELDII